VLNYFQEKKMCRFIIMNNNLINSIFYDIYFRICLISLICYISLYNCLYGSIIGIIFILILSYIVYNNIYITQENINNYYNFDYYLKNI
jgi:hypothetical protein